MQTTLLISIDLRWESFRNQEQGGEKTLCLQNATLHDACYPGVQKEEVLGL